MAKVTLAEGVQVKDMRKLLRGSRITLRRGMSGQLQMYPSPDMSGVLWSEQQQTHRQRFKEAVAYAKGAMADSQACAHYVKQAAQMDKRPFGLAVSDYFKGQNLLAEPKD